MIADDFKAIAQASKKLKAQPEEETIDASVLHICKSCEHRQWVDDDLAAWICQGCGAWAITV